VLTRDRIGALLLLAFSIFYGVRTLYIPLLPFQAEAAFTARSMPWALSVLGVVLSLVLLVRRGTGARVEAAGFQWRRAAVLCALMVAYGLTVRPAGFLISTSLFLIGGFAVQGERRIWLILAASIPIVVFFWVLMTQFLGVFIEAWPEFLKG